MKFGVKSPIYDALRIRTMGMKSGAQAGASMSGPEYLVLTADASLANERTLLAGDGLAGIDLGAGSTFTLNVTPGDGVDIVADAVAVDVTDIIGTGLTEDASNNIILGTPSTVTVSTTNNVSGTTHNHAITSSSNPGAAAAILASSAAGALTLVNLGLSGNVTSDWIPSLPDTYDIGSSTKLWRKGYLSELDALIFAEETISLVGGWLIIPKDQGSYAADVAAGATTVNFGKAMTVGNFIVSRASLKVEYMQVGSLVSGTTYNVTRNLDGTGANDWPAGTPFLVLGTTGDGRIELNAYDTPRIQILTQGATYNAQTENVRIGDMRDAFGTGSNTRYGIGTGDYSGGNYLSYNAEAAGKFVLRAGASAVWLDEDGISIALPATTAADINAYKFDLSGTVHSRLAGYYSGSTTHFLQLEALNISGKDAYTTVAARAGTGKYASLTLMAQGYGVSTTLVLEARDSPHLVDALLTTDLLDITGNVYVSADERIGGGLYVGGTGTDPGTGQLTVHSTTGFPGIFEVYSDTDELTMIRLDKREAAGTNTKRWDILLSDATGAIRIKPVDADGVFNIINQAATLNRLWLDTATGFMALGDSANANMTQGITINQGASDDEILALKSSDVAHGITTLAETDTYGILQKSEDTSGGLNVRGYKDADGAAGYALALQGVLGEAADTTKSTSGAGVVDIDAAVKSGTTWAAVGADGNLLTIRNLTTTRFIFDAEGSAHADVEWIVFDDYDDVALLADLEHHTDPIRGEFGDFLKYNRDELERLKLVKFNTDQHHFVNFTRLAMLHTGAIRQLAARLERAEQALLKAGIDPKQLGEKND